MPDYKLTPRENFDECLKPDGHPERFVNQYDYMGFAFYPYTMDIAPPEKGGPDKVNPWGVTQCYRADQPGAFPVHDAEHTVIKDFEEWQEYVHAPNIKYPEAAWEPWIKFAEENIDPKQVYRCAFVAPGIFEQLHNLGDMVDALAAFYECPDELKELIKYLVDFEIELCDSVCEHLHPDMMLHHDDWGSRTSTFLSVDMWEEFLHDPVKEVYSRWKENGTKIIIHHSDSFGATLVPDMIDCGIDVWQGVMTSNDIPAMIEKYKGQITFMGGLDGADIEKPDWTKPWVKEQVQKICKDCGPHSFIPCITQGLPMSTYDGLYDCISECISECSEEMPEFFK